MSTVLFPIAEYWWVYLGFIAAVIFLLLFDVREMARSQEPPSIRSALLWTGFWVALALAFNIGFYFFSLYQFQTNPLYANLPNFHPQALARQLSLEFLTAFLVEKALSVDNLFVFSVIFSYFAVPLRYQHRVLFLGILGAIICRGLFISVGTILVEYKAITIIFGAMLVFTGVKILLTKDEEPDIENNFALKLMGRFFPISPTYHGQKFIIRKGTGFFITPLLVALVVIEVSDIMFAIDSVPAVLGLSHEPLVIFTSNIFAILGLRSLYFALAGCQNRFHLLQYGLGAVLIFIGLKMTVLESVLAGKIPVLLSLALIVFFIGGSILMSLIIPNKDDEANAASIP